MHTNLRPSALARTGVPSASPSSSPMSIHSAPMDTTLARLMAPERAGSNALTAIHRKSARRAEARLQETDEVLFDRLARRIVGRDLERALPRLDRFVAEAGLLIEHGQIFQR